MSLRLPCSNCGIAAAQRDRRGLCDDCAKEIDALLDEIEQREFEDWDRYMTEMYRPR